MPGFPIDRAARSLLVPKLQRALTFPEQARSAETRKPLAKLGERAGLRGSKSGKINGHRRGPRGRKNRHTA